MRKEQPLKEIEDTTQIGIMKNSENANETNRIVESEVTKETTSKETSLKTKLKNKFKSLKQKKQKNGNGKKAKGGKSKVAAEKIASTPPSPAPIMPTVMPSPNIKLSSTNGLQDHSLINNPTIQDDPNVSIDPKN